MSTRKTEVFEMSTKCLLRRGVGVDISEYANRMEWQNEPKKKNCKLSDF